MRGRVRSAADFVRKARILPRRQLAVLVLGVGLACAATLGAWMNAQPLASACFSLLGLLVLVAVLHVRRRSGRDVASLRHEIASLRRELQSYRPEVSTLIDRIEFSHRRALAAVENERLAASDRHEALLSAIAAQARSERKSRATTEEADVGQAFRS